MNQSYLKASGLLIAITLGFLFPFGNQFYFLLLPLLILILFSSFLSLDWEKARLNGRILGLFPILILVVAFLTYFITSSLKLSLDWQLGFVLTALTPSALASPIIVQQLKGNLFLSIQNVLVSNFLAIIYIPLAIYLFFSEAIFLNPILIGQKMLFLFGIPFLFSMFIKKTRFQKLITPGIKVVVFPVWMLVLWIVISKNSAEMWQVILTQRVYVFGVFGLAFLNYGIGWLFSKGRDITMAISLGHKNTLISIWIALAFFSPQVALVPTLYILSHHLINSVLLGFKK